MNKININVRVTYMVSLQDVEVTDDVAIALAHYEGETLTNLPQNSEEDMAFNWITDHIREDDCCDYEAEIELLEINGEESV